MLKILDLHLNIKDNQRPFYIILKTPDIIDYLQIDFILWAKAYRPFISKKDRT